MAETAEISIQEYSDKVGISQPAIAYRMKNKKVLPGVLSYRFDVSEKKYVLVFDTSMTRKKAKKYFRNVA